MRFKCVCDVNSGPGWKGSRCFHFLDSSSADFTGGRTQPATPLGNRTPRLSTPFEVQHHYQFHFQHTHTHTCAHTHTLTHTHSQTHKHTHTHSQTHTHAHTHTHKHIHTHTHTPHTHTHTHTHTQLSGREGYWDGKRCVFRADLIADA